MRNSIIFILLFFTNTLLSQYNISVLNTSTTIENFNTFNGSGFQPTPLGGQLDSDGWAITGFSDGNLVFGGTNVIGDYARLTTAGGVTTGGIYKCTASSGFLMIQPGGTDFTPGSITMKIQNTTGSTITSFDVSYLLLLNNNEGRSNSFNFYYSTDDIIYNPVSNLDFTSPELPDVLGFQSLSRNTTINGVSIPNNGFLYLKWIGDDVSGSGSRDEFGIDNIQIAVYDFITPPIVTAGGMIVNEISNGPAGEQEYYEFLVIGSADNPLGNVDLSGWLIDDNNGDFEGLGAGLGIASGHMRIASGCLTSVKPGSLILIYNPADINPLISAGSSDPTDSDNDCVYIFTPLDPCIEVTNSRPNSSPATSSYFPFSLTTDTWGVIGLANGDGDVGQVRMPNGTFFHGFSYGNVSDLRTDLFPNFPSIFGGGNSFNVFDGLGTARNYYFNCGSFVDVDNFSRGSAGIDETPGLPNNDLNTYFINSIRTGTYDYSNLSNVNNCGSALTLAPCDFILDVDLLYFVSENFKNSIGLKWELANVEGINSITLQRSFNGSDFEDIFESDIIQQNSYEDFNYSKNNYYRLKFKETNGVESYSKIVYEEKNRDTEVLIYPNPNYGNISIKSESKIEIIKVYDCYGRHILDIKENFNDISLDLPKGIYYLNIENSFYKIQIL